MGLMEALWKLEWKIRGQPQKGRCMDKQPKVEAGDKVRIIKDSARRNTGKKGIVKAPGYGSCFDFRPDGDVADYWMSKNCGDEWEILQLGPCASCDA
jgi:hypothetical protein